MTDWPDRMRLPMWRHQAKEWEHRDDKARMRKWQMRTGKTKMCIDEACYWYERGEIDGVIIFGPNNVHLNWARKEVPKHVWTGTPYRSLAWNTTESHKASWCQWFDKFCQPTGKLDFLMVNYEALNNKRFLDGFLAKFVKSHPRYALVIDETHECRGHKSARVKQLRKLRAKAKYRRGLSGTIIDNSPLHAWSQYEILLESALGYNTFADFETHFAVKEKKKIFVKGRMLEIPVIVGYTNEGELTAAMAKLTSVVLREECDDLPELMREECRFELGPEQKRVYNELVRGSLARLDGGEVVPPKEGSALKSQLQQITRGWYVDDEGEVVDVVDDDHNPALQALLSQVALAGPKVIVFCRFVEDIKRCMRVLKHEGYSPVHYYGGTKKEDRTKHEDRFMRDPKCGPFVGQPLACGQGLDLSVATDIFWYSHLDGDLIHRKQADERGTQVGGSRVFVTDLIADGTGDDKLLADLVGKDLVQEDISGEGLRRFLEQVH